MSGIDSLITLDLDFSSAVVIWPHDEAPRAFQKFNAAHVEDDNDWIVFVPSDVDYSPFLKLALAPVIFMFHIYGDSKVIVYKEYM